jgi:O-antigen ligase
MSGLMLAVFFGFLGDGSEIEGVALDRRPMALAAVLVGCVFLSGPMSLKAVAGWGLCLLLTAVTGSRMATAALVLAPIFRPAQRAFRWKVVAICVSVVIGLLLLCTPMFRMRAPITGSEGAGHLFLEKVNSSGRFEAWPLILEKAWENPLLGAGVESAATFVPTVWPRMQSPHNDYLRIGFEFGIVGLALFLNAVVWQLWDLRRHIARSQGILQQAFAASWLAWMMFLVAACTDNPVGYSLRYMNPLFALLGAAYGVAWHTGACRINSKKITRPSRAHSTLFQRTLKQQSEDFLDERS